MCAVSLGAYDLELRFGNKRAALLPGDGETEYRCNIIWSSSTL